MHFTLFTTVANDPEATSSVLLNMVSTQNCYTTAKYFQSNDAIYIDHFTRCKQHWSRSTSCFSFL